MIKKVYVNACCFIEMACHLIGTHRVERSEDVIVLKRILQRAFKKELEVYTSILSVAECQAAYSRERDAKILNDEVKKLFRDILTSGQFVVLVQDTILIAERARNLYWAHGLSFSGADALHLGAALEMKCDEYLTFDDRPLKKNDELEKLGLTVVLPRNSKSLDLVDDTGQAHLFDDYAAQDEALGMKDDIQSGKDVSKPSGMIESESE